MRRLHASRSPTATPGATAGMPARALPRPRRRLPALRPLALAVAGAWFMAGPAGLQAQTAPTAGALPVGAQVVAGQAQIATQGSRMTVTNAPGTVLNWQSFNIGASAGVHFQQADAASKVLNRVTGQDPSAIFGSLTSNGQVWLLNPNGVLFGASARVDVAGLVASTLRLNDVDFLNQRFRFTGDGAGAGVRNEGQISTAWGGQVVLLGERVANAGDVSTPGGSSTLAAARSAELVDTGLPHLAVRVDLPAGEALNLGRVVADGGAVDIFGAIVNQRGLVRADTLGTDAQGRVVLRASDTLTLGAGSVTQAAASGPGLRGGAVDLLGTRIALVGDARADASGTAGGGTLRVGGGLQGRDASVPNADALWFGPQATLRADATGAQGTGGRIILWSNRATRAFGTLSARGGSAAGDGGFVETSGGWLDARPAQVDVSSRDGAAGQWLLDPNDITITSSGTDTNISGGPVFTSTGDSSIVTTATLAAALNAGTSVTVQTASSGANTQAGDILVTNATLSVAPSAPVTLTLSATRDIVVRNSTLESTAAPLSLDFRAAGGGFGVVDIGNSTLRSANGDITLGGTTSQLLPLPDGSTTTSNYRAAVGYAAGSLASQARRNGATAIDLWNSTLDAGSGALLAMGTTAQSGADAVLVGDSLISATTTLRGATVTLVGYADVSSGSVTDTGGVTVIGNGTRIDATSGLQMRGGGLWGVEISGGARVALTGTGVAEIDGFGRSAAGVALYSWDLDTNAASVGGSRLTVAGGGSLIVTARSSFTTALLLDNSVASPGPLLDLTGASGASLQVVQAGAGGSFASRVNQADLLLPASGSTTFSGVGGLRIDEATFTGGSGQLTLSGAEVNMVASTVNAGGSGLNLTFDTTGGTTRGVWLFNTIVTTNGGDITFGASQNLGASALPATSVARNWVRDNSATGGDALDLSGSTLDAGSGSIRGGGAYTNSSGIESGTRIFQSVLNAATIDLAGRSDTQIGVVVDSSSLTATSQLRLDGRNTSTSLPATVVANGTTVQLIDPASGSGSTLSFSGRNDAAGPGVYLQAGALGSANETRVIVSGASVSVNGSAAAGGTGVWLRGDSAAGGGLLLNLLGATSASVVGNVDSGSGAGLLVQYSNLLGPQASTGAPMLLQGNGVGGDFLAGTRIEFSTVSTGGTLTVLGRAVHIDNALVTGEAGVNIHTSNFGGSGDAGYVWIDQSLVRSEAAGAATRIEAADGTAAVGNALRFGGAGITVTASLVDSTGSGGAVVLNGRGDAAGGHGVTFTGDTGSTATRPGFHAANLSITGVAGGAANGVFSDDSSGGDVRLRFTNLTLTGTSPAGSTTNAGVWLSRGVLMQGDNRGAALIQGDNVRLGDNNATSSFSITGDLATLTVRSSRSMVLQNGLLDFSDGAGTTVALQADSDGDQLGRVRMNALSVTTRGGNFTASGQGVSSFDSNNQPIANNTAVREGATGVLVDGGTGIDTDIGGAIAINGLAAASVGGSQPGGWGVNFIGNNTLRGGSVAVTGSGTASHVGVEIGNSTTPAALNIFSSRISIQGEGNGLDSAGAPNAGISAYSAPGASSWNIRGGGSISLASTGVSQIRLTGVNVQADTFRANINFSSSDSLVLSGVTLDVNRVDGMLTNGNIALSAAGPLTLAGSVVSAGNSLTLTASGTGSNGSLVSALNTALLAGGALTITGNASDGGLGVSMLSGLSLSAASMSFTGTGGGIAFDDPLGTTAVAASTGPISITGRNGFAGQATRISGDWNFSSPTAITVNSDNALVLSPGGQSSLGPDFTAPRFTLDTVAPGGLTLGPGAGPLLDGGALGTALAGMPATSTTTLRVTGNANTLAVRGGLAVPGRLRVEADGIELQSGAQLRGGASGDAVVLGGTTQAAAAFVVNTGGSGVLLAPNGRWVVLVDSPSTFAAGGLVPAQTVYGLGTNPWSLDANGDYITPTAGSALGYTVAAATAHGSLSAALVKVYDASAGIVLDPLSWTLTGLASGDTLQLGGPTLATMNDKNVGAAKPVTPNGATTFTVQDANGNPVFGYGAPALTATVTPRAIAASGATAASRIYDGTTTATLANAGSVTPLAGDSVTLVAGTASFSDRNVGTAKPVALSGFTLAGADAGNYTLQPLAPTSADITPLALTPSGLTAQNKVYDSTATATLAGTASITPLAGDSVALAGTASGSFADKNVGSAKPVAVTGLALTGTDAGNYTLAAPALSADITPAALVVSGLVAQNRVYDATTAAALSGTPTVVALPGDLVTLAGSATGSFADKNVGSAKPVTVAGLTLTGTDAGNYTLSVAGLSADITPRALALTGVVVAPKVYDGTTAAPLANGGTVSGLAGDNVSLSAGTASFADRNAGTAKPVSLSGFALAGADAGNYSLVLPTGVTGDITPLALTLGGLTAQNKVYDSTATATLAGTASVTPLAGDSVALAGTASASFADKNVGTAKPVAVSGLALTGTDAANYTLAAPALAADITPATLTVAGLSALSKVYDTTTTATLAGTATVAPLGSDAVSLAGSASGAFADKTAGTAKPVTLGGLTLAGADAGNYVLALPALSANIAPASLGLAGVVVADKVYDGTRNASVSGTLTGVLAGDVVGVGFAGLFADANVGTAKFVNWTATVSGADAANYILAPALGGGTASINPALLTYVAAAAIGTAGQPLPVLTGTVSGFVGSDTQASATTGTLQWTTVASTASPAGRYAINGGGLSAANYSFAQASGNASALTLRTPAATDPASTSTTVATSAALVSVQVPVAMSGPTQGRVLDVTPVAGVGGTAAAPPTTLQVGADGSARIMAAQPGAAGGTGTGGATVGTTGTATGATAPTGAPAAPTTAAAPAAAAVAAALAQQAGSAAATRFAAVDWSRMPRDEMLSLLAARARYKAGVFSRGVYRLQQDPTLADVRGCRNLAELDTGVCLITEELKRQIQAAREQARAQAQAAQQARPLREGQRRVKQAALPRIERKLALLIGVNDYSDKRVPQLVGAVPDARAVRALLDQRLGYETTVIENPTRQNIVRAFNRLAAQAEANDSVVIYYAGHGVLVPVDGQDTGFWLPADSDAETPGTWLANNDIARLVAAIGAKQTMLISDSCYSGSLVGRDRVTLSAAGNADELLSRRAAVVMSSGGDEPVADEGKEGHSIFAWHFMQALKGLDQWQVGNSLFERVRAAVVREFPQTPQYGASRSLGHQGDTDYLFERRELEQLAP